MFVHLQQIIPIVEKSGITNYRTIASKNLIFQNLSLINLGFNNLKFLFEQHTVYNLFENNQMGNDKNIETIYKKFQFKLKL
jgi:hypothetical protein